MKLNYLNLTNIVHDIKIPKKGFKVVYSYIRLKKTLKLRKIRRNPRFYIRDFKNRAFDIISIDNHKYKLKSKVKRFYFDDFQKITKEERNLVLERFENIRNWMEKLIKKNKWPLDVGGNRLPLVKQVKFESLKDYSKSFKEDLKFIQEVQVEVDGEDTEVLEGNTVSLIHSFIDKWGIGQIWGLPIKKVNILSVWIAYIQASNASVYRSDNDRFFILEHYVMKNDISKKENIYSDKFREKLFNFCIMHGKAKGRFLRQKRSEVKGRVFIGIVGFYPITEKGEKFIKEKGKDIKQQVLRKIKKGKK